MSFWSKVKRIFLLLVLGFVLLFAFRLMYGYRTTPAAPQKQSTRDRALYGLSQTTADDLFSSKKNYASEKIVARPKPSVPAAPLPVDQKYEKTATVVSSTKNLAGDDAKVRGMVGDYRGIIQFEQSSGGGDNAPTVQMLIGIQPASFDEFCREIRTIGNLESFNVTKTDKTNEFLNLKAQRASLESSRAALVDLKNRDGKVDEFINLQYRILELDRELQALGVQLGDFDEVNEFCSVRLTLFEVREWWSTPPSLLHRLMVAFTWTVGYYALVVFSLTCCLLIAFLAVAILDKVARWAGAAKRTDGKPDA